MFMYSILGLVSRSTVIFLLLTHFCRCRSVFIYEVDRDRIAASIYLWLFYFYCSSSGSAADSREYFTVVVFNSLFTGHDHGKRCQAFQYGHIIGSAEDGYRLCLVADQCGEYCFGSLGMMLGALNWSNFIEGLGIITAVCVTLAIAGWLALLHFKIRVEGL